MQEGIQFVCAQLQSGKKATGEFFRLSPKDREKENQFPEEAGCSGLGTSKRKACPLQPDHPDDENE